MPLTKEEMDKLRAENGAVDQDGQLAEPFARYLEIAGLGLEGPTELTFDEKYPELAEGTINRRIWDMPGGEALTRMALASNKALTFNHWDQTKDLPPPEGTGNKLAEAMGTGIGFLAPVGVTAKATGLTRIPQTVGRLAGRAPVAGNVLGRVAQGATAGAGALGGYGALTGDPEHAKEMTALGAAFGAAPGLPVLGKIMENPAGRGVVDFAALTALGVKEGASLEDAMIGAAGMVGPTMVAQGAGAKPKARESKQPEPVAEKRSVQAIGDVRENLLAGEAYEGLTPRSASESMRPELKREAIRELMEPGQEFDLYSMARAKAAENMPPEQQLVRQYKIKGAVQPVAEKVSNTPLLEAGKPESMIIPERNKFQEAGEYPSENYYREDYDPDFVSFSSGELIGPELRRVEAEPYKRFLNTLHGFDAVPPGNRLPEKAASAPIELPGRGMHQRQIPSREPRYNEEGRAIFGPVIENAKGDIILGSGPGQAIYDAARKAAGLSPQERAGVARQRAVIGDVVPGSRSDRVFANFEKNIKSDPIRALHDLGADLKNTGLDGKLNSTQEAAITDYVKQAVASGAVTQEAAPKLLDRLKADAAMPQEVVDFFDRVDAGDAVSKKVLGADMVDFNRLSQHWGGGGTEGKNPLDTHLRRPLERINEVGNTYESLLIDRFKTHIKDLSVADRRAMGDFMAARDEIQTYSEKSAKEKDPAKQAEYDALVDEAYAKADDAINRFSDKDGLIGIASEIAADTKAFHGGASPVREELTGRKLGEREAYYKVKEKDFGWLGQKEPGGKPSLEGVKQKTVRALRRPLGPYARGKTEGRIVTPESARRRKAEGPPKFRETDPNKVLGAYAKEHARGVTNQLALNHINNFADYVELRGHKDVARQMREKGMDMYNPIPSGWQLGPLGAMVEWLGRGFSRATFTFNPSWSLATQPSSVVFPAGKIKIKDMPRAEKYANDPDFREYVDNLHTMKMKDYKASDPGAPTVGEEFIDPDLGLGRSLYERMADKSGELGRSVERWTGYQSGAMHYVRGKELGLKGQDLNRFVSDNIAKDQSRYDRLYRAKILNNRILTSVVPAQSFAVELNNAMRELLNPKIKIGEFEQDLGTGARDFSTPQTKARVLAQTVVMGFIADKLKEKLTGHGLFSPSSMLPFSSAVSPMFDSYDSGGNYVYSIQEAIMDAERDIEKGRWEMAASRLVRIRSRWGAQMSKILQTQAATQGRHSVDLSNADALDIMQSLIFGPYATEQGQAVIDAAEGKKKEDGDWGGSLTE